MFSLFLCCASIRPLNLHDGTTLNGGVHILHFLSFDLFWQKLSVHMGHGRDEGHTKKTRDNPQLFKPPRDYTGAAASGLPSTEADAC